jgi:hypothetical protein
VEPPQIQVASSVPKILETMKDLERVRRFVVSCMNIDLQRAEAKAKLIGKPLTDEERERLEIDWGTIPGVDKPFLKQPGAEKVMFWLKLKPKYFKQSTELDGGHLEMVCSVKLFTKKGNEEVWEGPDCSCSTMESNYRFRWAKREGNELEPNPTQDEADRLKRLGLGRWKYVTKYVRGQAQGKEWKWFDRVDNPNIHDERNKVRQIGEKRGLVKSVRTMGAMSELFVAAPDEWDVPPEDEEGSPSTDADHTEGGRRIVDEHGRSPSGKPVTPQARHEDAQAAGRAKAEELRKRMEETPKTPPERPKSAYAERQEEINRTTRVAYLIRTNARPEVRVMGFLDEGPITDFFFAVTAKRIEDPQDRSVSWQFGGEYVPKFEVLCRDLKINIERVGP